MSLAAQPKDNSSKVQKIWEIFNEWEGDTLQAIESQTSDIKMTAVFTIKPTATATINATAESLQQFVQSTLIHPHNKDWSEFSLEKVKKSSNWQSMRAIKYKEKRTFVYGDRDCYISLSYVEIIKTTNKNEKMSKQKGFMLCVPLQVELIDDNETIPLLQNLDSYDLKEAVRLPKGEDLNEWIASNTVDFFDEVSLLYSIISEYCTKQSCPSMSADSKYQNNTEYKKPFECSASEHISLSMSWIEKQIRDQRIFPVEDSIPFPKEFKSIIQKILTGLLEIYEHIYQHHIVKFIQLDSDTHLNICFEHFTDFIKEFELVNEQKLAALNAKINQILPNDAQKRQIYEAKYQCQKIN